MYSLQHVFWRGAMALSLLVVGGVGAGVAEAPVESEEACVPAPVATQALREAARREVASLQRARQLQRLLREGA